MATWVALLRGINVVGANQLPMKDLVTLCGDCGFLRARTLIQSGNAIFESRLQEAAVRKKLEQALTARLGKSIAVMLRTPAELRTTLDANPFPDREPSKVLVAFLDAPLPHEAFRNLVTPGNEQVLPGKREIYVYYPEGMGRSRFRLPLGKTPATMRNINTVGKLVSLAEQRA